MKFKQFLNEEILCEGTKEDIITILNDMGSDEINEFGEFLYYELSDNDGDEESGGDEYFYEEGGEEFSKEELIEILGSLDSEDLEYILDMLSDCEDDCEDEYEDSHTEDNVNIGENVNKGSVKRANAIKLKKYKRKNIARLSRQKKINKQLGVNSKKKATLGGGVHKIRKFATPGLQRKINKKKKKKIVNV